MGKSRSCFEECAGFEGETVNSTEEPSLSRFSGLEDTQSGFLSGFSTRGGGGGGGCKSAFLK